MPWRQNKREADLPPTPPPPPLPERVESPGRFYVRKTINASEWEAARAQEAELPQVMVTGLPNCLLSEGMLTTMIEQTEWLSQYIRGFKASPGSYTDYGQVLISVQDYAAACWCVEYFNNCRWGGCVQLNAEIISNGTAKACSAWEPACEWGWPADYSVDIPPLPGAEDLVPSDLWDDLDEDRTDDSSPTLKKSSAAAWLEEATQSLKEERAQPESNSTNGSDASTRDEESESGDESVKVGSAYSLGQ